jgi:5,5'-dehydrodivanillate O-demethylase
MISAETNRRLTEVGPGTPMGNLLRRYWQPIAGASEFDRKAIKPLRILGEDLVLFRTTGGAYGLVPKRCHHRGADISFGFVEDEGIRCHYHGWKYDVSGACVDRPFDRNVNPSGRTPMKSGPGYLAREKAGLVWAYMGPAPAPELPDWEFFSWENTFKQVAIAEIPCNWFQCQENTVDPVHFEWLHNNRELRRAGDQGPFSPPTVKMMVEDRPYGLLSRRHREGADESSPLWNPGRAIVWPNAWYFGHHMEWKVPVDDTRTLYIAWSTLRVPREREPYTQGSIPTWYGPVKDDQGEWISTHVTNQDVIAWMSQGVVSDRTNETLGASDVGVVALRRRMLEDLDAVEQGRDPRGIVRDPGVNQRMELPCIGQHEMKHGLPLAQMQEHPILGDLLRDFLIMAGQPDDVRREFETVMGVKTTPVDISKMVQK